HLLLDREGELVASRYNAPPPLLLLFRSQLDSSRWTLRFRGEVALDHFGGSESGGQPRGQLTVHVPSPRDGLRAPAALQLHYVAVFARPEPKPECTPLFLAHAPGFRPSDGAA